MSPRTRQPSFTFSGLLNAASVNPGNFFLRAGDLPTPAFTRVVDRVAQLQPEILAQLAAWPQTKAEYAGDELVVRMLADRIAEPDAVTGFHLTRGRRLLIAGAFHAFTERQLELLKGQETHA